MENFDPNPNPNPELKDHINSPISSNCSTTKTINNVFTTTLAHSTKASTLLNSSDNNTHNNNNSSYPTTFVEADAFSFKQVVQMLTGSAETTAKHLSKNSTAPTTNSKITGPKKQPFKLFERRSNLKSFKNLSPLPSNFSRQHQNLHSDAENSKFSPKNHPEIFSPSVLDFPSLSLSPVTPLIGDPFRGQSPQNSAQAMAAEDQAIANKGFYLHPSPRTMMKDAQLPTLLPLFPVASPTSTSATDN